MPTYTALLRGINVSGQKKIKMAELKSLFQKLGYSNVDTYIQSGNVVFDSGRQPATIKLEIEYQILNHFGYEVKVFIITREELKKILSSNPFTKVPETEYNRLHVVILSDYPTKEGLQKLLQIKSDNEFIELIDKFVYLYTPDGIGKSKLNNNSIEKKLGVTATARNFRTINKLFDLSDR